MTPPADGGEDDLRIAFAQRLEPELHSLENIGPVVLEDDVAAFDHLEEEVAPGLHGQVDRDAFLPGVVLREVGGHAVDAGHHRPSEVARGRFDLDDAGAHVGQESRGDRAGEGAGEVEHGDVRERRVHTRNPRHAARDVA